MKAKTIKSRTDKGRKSRAKKLKTLLVTVMKHKAFNGFRMVFIYDVTSQVNPNKKYRVEFRSSPAEPINVDNWHKFAAGDIPIYANCTCPDFKYRWETVLHKKGMARIKTSNGAMPDVTNPTYKASYCKHILAAFDSMQTYIRRRNFDDIGERTRKNKQPEITKKVFSGLNEK